MINILKGPIHSMFIKEINTTKNGLNILTASTVLKQDALFYQKRLGRITSFDYNTVMPSREEAEDWLNRLNISNDTKEYPNCLYANNDELTFEYSISNQEFKKLKKEYKNKELHKK